MRLRPACHAGAVSGMRHDSAKADTAAAAPVCRFLGARVDLYHHYVSGSDMAARSSARLRLYRHSLQARGNVMAVQSHVCSGIIRHALCPYVIRQAGVSGASGRIICKHCHDDMLAGVTATTRLIGARNAGRCRPRRADLRNDTGPGCEPRVKTQDRPARLLPQAAKCQSTMRKEIANGIGIRIRAAPGL